MIPNKLANVPLIVAKTFRKLKKLPDEFTVWYSLFQEGKFPHFLVIWKQHCGFIMHVTDTSQQLVEATIHGDLFDTNDEISVDSLGATESDVLNNFRASLPDGVTFPLKSIVVFPNVNRGTLDTVKTQLNNDTGVTFLDKQQLSDASFAQYLVAMVPAGANKVDLTLLRQAFTPETIIPSNFSAKQTSNLEPAKRNTKAQLTPLLLDIEQDWCSKNNLYLPPELETISTPQLPHEVDIKCQLVTGVAGSGKSLVLLYRALNSVKLSKGARVLVLTHNTPLLNELRERFEELSEGKYKITLKGFSKWAVQCLRPMRLDIIGDYQILNIIKSLQVNEFTTQFLKDEIGYIKDHNIREEKQYLDELRIGQKKGLTQVQRRKVWKVFKSYQNRLKDEGKIDWHGLALRFHDKAMSGECGFPHYDYIFVDEAQFFAKSWFEIVKKALRPGGQLFLAADPTQGFLKRKQSWKASGLEVRGRTTKLQKAYRNSPEILGFATQFYKSKQADTENDDAINLIDNNQINQPGSKGISPEIIFCANESDCQMRLIHELKSLYSQTKMGSQPILILHANPFSISPLLRKLEQTFPNQIKHKNNEQLPRNKTFCQLSPINAATGLEAPIVFLLGIDHLLEKEDNPTLTNDEKAEMITQNTQKLYMAFTRASTSLVVFTSSKKRELKLNNFIQKK